MTTEPYIAPDSHRPHGSYVKRVVERCECEPCVADKYAYDQRRRRAMNRPDELWLPYVPAGPARRHLTELAKAGVGLERVVERSGVAHGTLTRLVYGSSTDHRPPSRRIRPSTMAAILSVTADDAADGAPVPAGPTWALVDDLVARGWTKGWIAAQIGQTTPGLQLGRTSVSARHARQIAALHARLVGRRGPGRSNPWITRRAQAAQDGEEATG